MISSSIQEKDRCGVHKYPWVGEYYTHGIFNNDKIRVVVLFTSWRSGVLLYTSDSKAYTIGYTNNTWPEDKFIPFFGKITIDSAGL